MASESPPPQRPALIWSPREFALADYEIGDETMGSKEKFWVRFDDDDREWLCKLTRERDGVVRGEDWAEWIVHHLAALIGIPTATVQPATVDGRRAVLSRSVLHSDAEALVHGNSLLSGHDPEYDLSILRENPRYTPANVRDALDGVPSPVEMAAGAPECTGFDVWAGYLLLDAWVAGRDRHHENWAVIRMGNRRRLAPSFDHGNALGFTETEIKQQAILLEPATLGRWLARGHSHHFAGRPSLVAVAHEALQLAAPRAARYWLERLDGVDPEQVRAILEAVPLTVLSGVQRRFAELLLHENRRRVLDGH